MQQIIQLGRHPAQALCLAVLETTFSLLKCGFGPRAAAPRARPTEARAALHNSRGILDWGLSDDLAAVAGALPADVEPERLRILAVQVPARSVVPHPYF